MRATNSNEHQNDTENISIKKYYFKRFHTTSSLLKKEENIDKHDSTAAAALSEKRRDWGRRKNGFGDAVDFSKVSATMWLRKFLGFFCKLRRKHSKSLLNRTSVDLTQARTHLYTISRNSCVDI